MADEGQASAESTGSTAGAPGSSEAVQTTQSGSGEAESFFDPKSIEGKPELVAAYKQMQADYTKKMQGIKGNQAKLDAYSAYEKDPQGTLRKLAQQHGIKILEGTDNKEPWEPKTWDEVLSEAEKRAEAKVLQRLEPMFGQVQDLKTKNMETYLDQNFSDWRTYETQMVDLVTNHPTLANNPDLLYKLAVPESVIQSRAAKEALKKIQGQASSAQVSAGSTTHKTAVKSNGPLSFNQAIEAAKAELAAKGIRPN